VRSYFKKHPFLFPLVVILTVGSPFLGFILAGWQGVVVSLVLGLVVLCLGFYAITKVVQTDTWES
jgi:hypothetical protein